MDRAEDTSDSVLQFLSFYVCFMPMTFGRNGEGLLCRTEPTGRASGKSTGERRDQSGVLSQRLEWEPNINTSLGHLLNESDWLRVDKREASAIVTKEFHYVKSV